MRIIVCLERGLEQKPVIASRRIHRILHRVSVDEAISYAQRVLFPWMSIEEMIKDLPIAVVWFTLLSFLPDHVEVYFEAGPYDLATPGVVPSASMTSPEEQAWWKGIYQQKLEEARVAGFETAGWKIVMPCNNFYRGCGGQVEIIPVEQLPEAEQLHVKTTHISRCLSCGQVCHVAYLG